MPCRQMPPFYADADVGGSRRHAFRIRHAACRQRTDCRPPRRLRRASVAFAIVVGIDSADSQMLHAGCRMRLLRRRRRR